MYNKEILSGYIGESNPESRIIVSDSIVIIDDKTVTKIPQKSCVEELYILDLIKNLEIKVPTVITSGEITTPFGNFESYTMSKIMSGINIIDADSEVFNPKYYSFLTDIFKKFGDVRFAGYGAITLAEGGEVTTEFRTKKELFHSVVNRALLRPNPNLLDVDLINHNIDNEVGEQGYGQLVHSDLLNNIIFSRSEKIYYLIDPQTNTSSANEYWDLSSYLLYANAFSKTHMLEDFVAEIKINNWNEFVTTVQVIALERMSYYSRHDTRRVDPMPKFVAELDNGCVLIGNNRIERRMLCQ